MVFNLFLKEKERKSYSVTEILLILFPFSLLFSTEKKKKKFLYVKY